MDPFFIAKKKALGAPIWGQHSSYTEDIHRTYPGHLPKRDPKAFERALEFRKREVAEHTKVKQENTTFRSLLDESSRNLQDMTKVLGDMTTEYSKLKRDYERAKSSGRSDSSIPSVPSAETTSSMPTEVLPSNVPNTCRQADQHSDEERHTGRGDTSGDVPIREESVSEGS